MVQAIPGWQQVRGSGAEVGGSFFIFYVSFFSFNLSEIGHNIPASRWALDTTILFGYLSQRLQERKPIQHPSTTSSLTHDLNLSINVSFPTVLRLTSG